MTSTISFIVGELPFMAVSMASMAMRTRTGVVAPSACRVACSSFSPAKKASTGCDSMSQAKVCSATSCLAPATALEMCVKMSSGSMSTRSCTLFCVV